MSRFLSAAGATALAIALAIPFCVTQASADSERVFYAFVGHGARDGFRPSGGLIADKDGNLYGTTLFGGSADQGTVFKLTPQGSETVIHSFTGSGDGDEPSAGLLMGADGTLYGTTTGGGAQGDGTVFQIAPDGTETILYSFAGGSDGRYPAAELVADQSGNLYGTTAVGGTKDMGTVFKLAPDGTETVLHSFLGGGNDGAHPEAGLSVDASGNLYGTTSQGSGSNAGMVFKIAPDGTEKVVHGFTSGTDGATPTATLVPDGRGNMYGTAMNGGTGDCNSGEGCGVIFKIAQDDTFSVVYSFPDQTAGRGPASRLLISNGRRKILYGTTDFGGDRGLGTVFKLTLKGKETVLHSFSRPPKTGYTPSGPLTADPSFTHLFGETLSGGKGRGVVYVLRPKA